MCGLIDFMAVRIEMSRELNDTEGKEISLTNPFLHILQKFSPALQPFPLIFY
jgi:hypothetical protein